MSASKEGSLSSDELRKRLYQTFKNKGVLDTLKVQLRNQLIQGLNYHPVTGPDPVPRRVPVKFDSLLVSACNSIVADHLLVSGYEYTLSVFYPECGLSKDKALKKEELLQLLRISPESALHASLSSNKETDKGFLVNLLTQLTHQYTPSVRHDVDTQTTSHSSYGESLVEKMKQIDREYENYGCTGEKRFSFQSHLATYRKETQAQLEAEMNTKMQHFKEVEIAKVRMEEKSKYHQEFEKLKRELERTYEVKATALMDREKNAIDRLQRQQEIEEKNVYMQRQSLLKEIETQRNRENELRMRTEEFDKTCQIHQEKMKTMDELLRRRELAVKTSEDTFDQRLNNELSRYQLQLKEDFLKRTEKLTESETKNKLESARLQKESAIIDAGLEEHSRACAELKQLKAELDTAQQQISLLNQQKEMLNERLESVSDYPSLKRETAELKGRLRLLQKELEDAQGETRLLQEAMMKPSSEQLALQMELRRLQCARKLDREEFDEQKQVLQAQLHREVERCAQLTAQLTECEDKSGWMKKYVEDIRVQLQQTQQDRALLRARLGYDKASEAGAQLLGSKSLRSISPDPELDLVAEAKARVQELQRESETLEEAYRSYQQRAVHSTMSSHMLPARSLSPQHVRPSHHPKSVLRKQDTKHSYAHASEKPQRAVSSVDRNLLPPSQLKVGFTEELKQHNTVVSSDHDLQSENKMFSPLTPHSDCSLKMKLQAQVEEEALLTPVALLQTSFDRQAPPTPHTEVVTSGESSPVLSSPHSPQLRSTARDHSSPPKLQQVFSSSESSPQPEKISIQDLTAASPEPGRIPELLLDTAVARSEEAPDGPAAPQPKELTEGQAEVPDDSPRLDEKEEENDDEKWERERKERLERRQREEDEARERELQELERLEKETLLQEAKQPEEEESGAGNEEQEKEKSAEKEESKGENPLEKYMKMVLEAREKQSVEGSEKDEAGHSSPDINSLSEDKDDSIAAVSIKEDDDDFW
ncbi:centriole and centriolar satellite protein ofd1 isoform X2 [Gouania willdenowi]|uniref:centriole and centriolar satellite protein ofd1 isoform X2 n=1 Tax=Gouania willdenowi TaxID=441366 RepID=UPI001054E66A|nr:oral-facial-digital syndrome 1 protein isoform X2 [Gouania willdenowi]